jgi:hypothetical protein
VWRYNLNLAVSALPALLGLAFGSPAVFIIGVPIAVFTYTYGMRAKRLFGEGDLASARTALRRSRIVWWTGVVVIAVLGALAIAIEIVD